jgi:hypothetical protein
MYKLRNGGGGGIRTHGTFACTTVFETAPFDHSGTPPRQGIKYHKIEKAIDIFCYSESTTGRPGYYNGGNDGTRTRDLRRDRPAL